MNKKLKKNIILFLLIIFALFGKLVRHTILYETLVKQGSGYQLIELINNGNTRFALTIGDGVNEQDAGANAVFLYEHINFLGITTNFGFEIYISIIFNFILFIMFWKLKDSLSWKETLFLLLTVSVLNIWDFCLAKEPVQMLYFLVMFIILRNNKLNNKQKYILCALMYFLCTITYRNYYITMLIFFVLLMFFYKIFISKIKRLDYKKVLLVFFITFISYLILIQIMKTFAYSEYQKLLWVRLNKSIATTGINAFFNSTNTYVFTFEIILTIVRMLFPIEIVRFGPQYFIYFVYQLFLTSIVFKNLKNINLLSHSKRIALFIILSFIMGSALFEPDFGSWVRHEAVTFPVIIILSNVLKEKEDSE